MNNIDWLTNMKIAHRGFHDKNSPENSMSAFKNAIEFGYAIELDIHILNDGKLVVFHDDNLKRMTGMDKEIEACSYDEIKVLYLGSTKEKIPLLSEVLELVKGQVPLMIEIKNRGKVGALEEALVKMLNNYLGEFVIQSFNPFSVGYFAKVAPGFIRGQLSGSYKDEKLEFYKKFLLKNLLLNFISKPHFINYEIQYLSNIAIWLQKLKGKLILGWTARTIDEYKKALCDCKNAVFEGFRP